MIKYDDLEWAVEYVTGGEMFGNEAYLCRESGVIHWYSELDDEGGELPDDVGDPDKYVPIPASRDLDLGKALVLDFTREVLPDREREVREIFSRRGAYRRFKDMLDRIDMLQQWYDYEAAARKRALLEWCECNGIEIED